MALSSGRAWRVAVVGAIAVLVAALLYQSGAFALPWADDRDDAVVAVTDVETGETACVVADVADTRPERFEGLGGRESLPNGSGMWFAYDEPRKMTYVMRDMNFAIDVVFVGAGGRVTGVESMRAPEPGEDGEDIRASGYGQYVLEVPRGYAAANGIDEGDAVDVTYGTRGRAACEATAAATADGTDGTATADGTDGPATAATGTRTAEHGAGAGANETTTGDCVG